MKAPKEYHKLFDIVKSFFIVLSLSTCHSVGLNRLTRNKTTLTPTEANKIHIQIAEDKGSIKEKVLAFLLVGFFIIILIPRLMNGLVKSTTRSLSDDMVMAENAISAV